MVFTFQLLTNILTLQFSQHPKQFRMISLVCFLLLSLRSTSLHSPRCFMLRGQPRYRKNESKKKTFCQFVLAFVIFVILWGKKTGQNQFCLSNQKQKYRIIKHWDISGCIKIKNMKLQTTARAAPSYFTLPVNVTIWPPPPKSPLYLLPPQPPQSWKMSNNKKL